MRVEYLLVYWYITFPLTFVRSKNVLNEIHVCVCLWEIGGMKIYLGLSLDFVKVCGYDLTNPNDGPCNSNFLMALSTH